MATVHLFRSPERHTTARYFEGPASLMDGYGLKVWTERPDLSRIGPDDLFVYVDPASDWPLGIEDLPCPTGAYMIDVHRGLAHRLALSRFFDAVFVAQKDYVGAFEAVGHRHAHWLPLACAPHVHHKPSELRDFDVGFVGQLGVEGTPRHSILTTVLPRYGTNDYARFYKPEAMAGIYGRSKIVFNVAVNGDVNMRVFEAWASGALLVTNRVGNGFDEIFKDGVNCVCYASAEEAVEKIDHYLAHDAEREAIAAEGLRAALEEHTYARRWQDIVNGTRRAFGAAPVLSYGQSALRDLYGEVFVALRQPWRLPAATARYGPGASLPRNLAIGWGRWANSKIPLTRNAWRARNARRAGRS